MNKAPMKDMVVILPGILGSVLQKDGKDLWAVSGQSIWQVLTKSGETIRDLKQACTNASRCRPYVRVR